MKFQFKTIRNRLTFWFIFLTFLFLIMVIVVIYFQRVQSIESGSIEKLTAIRNLKVAQVNSWIDERMDDIKTISGDYEIRDLETVTLKKSKAQSTTEVLKTAKYLLSSYIQNYEDYNEIFIIHPKTGKIFCSTNQTSEGVDKSENLYFTEPLKTGKPYIKDVYYSKALHKNAMTFSAPIYCREHGTHIVGILVARVNLRNSLYSLLLDRTGMGQTGETLIVNKDGLALNELRWYANAPLRLKITAEPAKRAAQGETGTIEVADYRNIKVLAAYTHVAKTNWGFVAKQDLREINAPIKTMIFDFIFLVAVAIVIVLVVSFFLVRSISQPVTEMIANAKKMQAGDFSVRNKLLAGDELSYLALSFNSLAASISSRIFIQKNNVDIAQLMVEADQLNTFSRALLEKLLHISESNLGAFYLINEQTDTFEPLFTIGLNSERLQSFHAKHLEGEFGHVLTSKKITRLEKIPENTIFSFKTFVGTAIPREIINVPLIAAKKVIAVIALASLKPYADESLEILNQSHLAMNSAISNLISIEETRKTAQELEVKNDELEVQANTLKTQSDELYEQNIELELQQKQLEEANRLKSEFLSNMSHELRTPLNSVMALSRVLLMQSQKKLSQEEYNYLETIERNGKQLLNLINDILDLSKIEAGKMDVVTSVFSIRSTTENIVESLVPVANAKGIKLMIEIAKDFPEIESDEIRVTQILQNLIGNAIKFSEKGYVKVTAESDENYISICVADTGIGILEKDLPHIFDEFRQVDGSTARRFEGTGLGLAIAHKAAKMLGGEITVDSIYGKGSKFTLTLPIEWKGTAPVFEPFVFEQDKEITPERKTVLVVDDEPAIIDIISKYLSREGYKVVSATTGEQVLKLANKFRPFAITLDVIMPEMDGWEVLQKLKINPSTANIPVIIVSISDNKETGFALGAVGYVTKPINKNALLNEIHKLDVLFPQSVMVVDDNEIDRNEISRLLEQSNINVIKLASGQECLSQLEKVLPDVLMLDLMMPAMDGFEVLQKIRSNPKTQTLPVIIVTAKDLTNQDRKRLNGHVSSILAKSDMKPEKLFEAIKKALLELEQKSSEKSAASQESQPRILLVEDNEATIIQVKSVLETENYLVDVARGGKEAIAYVKQIIPDGLILDLMMPEIDGFQVLENIRETKTTAKIPVLVLTAKDLTREELQQLSTNHIQQLIHKGDVNKKKLLFKVKLMLGSESIIISSKKEQKIKKDKTTKVRPQKSKKIPGLSSILVVEDNPDNLLTIEAILKDKYNILKAIDGEQALELARSELPDLILLDIALPKLDGLSVVAKLKDEVKTKNIPVIAMTALAMKGDKERIIQAGCDDYISKPVDTEEVINKIEQWLKN